VFSGLCYWGEGRKKGATSHTPGTLASWLAPFSVVTEPAVAPALPEALLAALVVASRKFEPAELATRLIFPLD